MQSSLSVSRKPQGMRINPECSQCTHQARLLPRPASFEACHVSLSSFSFLHRRVKGHSCHGTQNTLIETTRASAHSRGESSPKSPPVMANDAGESRGKGKRGRKQDDSLPPSVSCRPLSGSSVRSLSLASPSASDQETCSELFEHAKHSIWPTWKHASSSLKRRMQI